MAELEEKVFELQTELETIDTQILEINKFTLNDLMRNKEILRLKYKASEAKNKNAALFKRLCGKIDGLEAETLKLKKTDGLYLKRNVIKDEIDRILIELYDNGYGRYQRGGSFWNKKRKKT